MSNKLQHAPSEYMQRFYFDAISYQPEILQSLIDMVGPEKIMFGTDNPFFPPLDTAKDGGEMPLWPSTVKVQECIDGLIDPKHRVLIQSENAVKLFNL